MLSKALPRIVRIVKYILAVVLLIAVLAVPIVAPPTPHNVKGVVYDNDGSQVPTGTPVSIQNNNLSETTLTYTSGPPSKSGSYSVSIDGNTGDNITVMSWTSTNYGSVNTLLQSGSTEVNINLNITRPGERNVSIIYPSDDAVFSLGEFFNVTVNITAIGGQDSLECNATINFSDTSFIYLPNSDSVQSLGNISLGSSILAWWNVSSNFTGSTDITIITSCELDSLSFDDADNDTITGITIEDNAGPVIRLESPYNNTWAYEPEFTFSYNASDPSNIYSCSLIIDESIVATNYSVQPDTSQSFIYSLAVGQHYWSINCTDNSSGTNLNSSLTTLNISVRQNLPPQPITVEMEDPVTLVAGTSTTVFCNSTVYDSDNATDISGVNATFFDTAYTSSTPDDNNYHYSNSSCAIAVDSITARYYSCSFEVEYYANNGEWTCNITAKDLLGNLSSNTTNTTVDDLIAVDVLSSVVDYGSMPPVNISSDDVSITILNAGNVDINLSLEGYGISEGDGLAMNCTYGTIPVTYERYSTSAGTTFSQMINLTSTPQQIADFTIPQRTDDSGYGADAKSLYWKLQTPTAVGYRCDGNIILATEIG